MQAILSTACAMLLTLSGCHAQENAPVQIRVDSLRLEHLDREQIQAEVLVSATAPKGIHIEKISLSHVRVNGVPVFADPIENITTQGSSITLPPMHLHLYVADMDNTAWLQQTLRDSQASLTGVAAVIVRPNLLQRLFLGQDHFVAVEPIQKKIPVHLVSGVAGHAAALLLQGFSPLWPSLRAISEPKGDHGAEPSETVRIRTCWIPATAARRCVKHLAFLMGSQALTASQAAEPWRFDPLLNGQAPADLGSVEVTLETPGTATLVVVTVRGRPELQRVLLMPQRRWVSYADTAQVFAELRAVKPGQELASVLMTLPAAPSTCGVGSWQEARVYRLAGEGRETVPVALRVRSERGTLRFSRPVDDTAVGSPVVGSSGVLGVVQSERTGTALTAQPTDCGAH